MIYYKFFGIYIIQIIVRDPYRTLTPDPQFEKLYDRSLHSVQLGKKIPHYKKK